MVILPDDLRPQSFGRLLKNSMRRSASIYFQSIPIILFVSAIFFFLNEQINQATYESIGKSYNPISYHILNEIILSVSYAACIAFLVQRHSTVLNNQIKAMISLLSVAPFVILAAFLYQFVVLAGSIFFIVPGILFIVWFIFYPQIIAFEKAGIIQAFKRSLKLVKGSYFVVLSVLLIMIGVDVFFIYLQGLIPHEDYRFIFYLLKNVIVIPFSASLYFLLYLDLRTRKEAFDYHIFEKQVI